MALFEMTKSEFRPIEKASFSEAKIMERGDLQRILRGQISVLGQELFVLTEEFGDWEGSKRRIDLQLFAYCQLNASHSIEKHIA